MIEKKPVRKRKLFQPDKIATEIHRALLRDFTEAQHVYCLNEDTVLYALNRQTNDLLKKYLSEDHDKDKAESEAFLKFREVNDHMAEVNSELRDYFSVLQPGRINQHVRTPERIFLRARSLMHFVLRQDCHLEDVFHAAKHSAGSSLGVSYANTSPEAKFTLPMTVTERVKPYMTEYFSWDKSLRDAVHGMHSKPITGWYKVVEGSRATTVDKTTEKRRFICVEPTGNMFLQQGLMQMMYERLADVGLVLPDIPDLHKWIARTASISGDKATVDWSSASDCVSIEVLRWLLPPAWFQLVWDLRCDTTAIQGDHVKLHMISSMGNATTFPLETLVFWTLGVATILTEDGSNSLFPERKHLRRMSVFGDDCIIPTRYASRFIEVCESVGFMINKEKSFYDPAHKFRESCGGDYLSGYDVRPFYLKAPTSNRRSSLEPWLYIIGNSLLKKYIQYFGKLSYVYFPFWKTYFDLFRRYKLELKLVPSDFPDDAGFKGGFDLPRFQRLYRPTLATITRSSQGTYCFAYCHFRYWKQNERYDELRYNIWLKKSYPKDRLVDVASLPHRFLDPLVKPKALALTFPTRRKGGYVVAKAISSHWELPSLNGT